MPNSSCIAASELDSQAKVASALAHGLILGGVAIMIASIGFSITSAGSSQPGGPRPPMSPGQFPAPAQPPFPHPMQERPQQ